MREVSKDGPYLENTKILGGICDRSIRHYRVSANDRELGPRTAADSRYNYQTSIDPVLEFFKKARVRAGELGI